MMSDSFMIRRSSPSELDLGTRPFSEQDAVLQWTQFHEISLGPDFGRRAEATAGAHPEGSDRVLKTRRNQLRFAPSSSFNSCRFRPSISVADLRCAAVSLVCKSQR